VEVLLESRENDTGMVVLSKEKADKMRIWTRSPPRASATSSSRAPSSAVKGGLSVDIGVKAFLPGSQVDLRPIRNLDKLIGEKFKFKVINSTEARQHRPQPARPAREGAGDAEEGHPPEAQGGRHPHRDREELTDYGRSSTWAASTACSHHRHELGPRRHPSEMLNVGDELRVSCSVRPGLRARQPGPQTDPGGSLGARGGEYPPGTRIGGKVVSLTDYGAFIEMEPGVEGLVHISE